MNIQNLIKDLSQGMRLDEREAKDLCGLFLDEKINSHQISAILALMSSRNYRASEVLGFRKAIKERGVKLDLSQKDAIDVCGTGGDGKHTFNISTAVSFVVAALGHKVIKHGNYAVSSSSGSSDILMSLGYQFKTDHDALMRELDKAGLCFLHAPLFYPILKSVGPVRKDLGFKTIFNLLGPLLNPADTKFAITGVYNLPAFRLYQEILPQILDNYYLVHTLDGYDEISLTAPTKVVSKDTEILLDPDSLMWSKDFKKVDSENLKIQHATPKEAFIAFLEGKANSDLNAVVAVNAAFAIMSKQKEFNLSECVKLRDSALEAIKSGACMDVLNTLLGV